MRYFLITLMVLSSFPRVQAQPFTFFVGTYNQQPDSAGIYVFTMSRSGRIKSRSQLTGVSNPSFLSLSPNRPVLYACLENENLKDCGIAAFRFNPKQGVLSKINQLPAGGLWPCYVSVHQSGEWVCSANYGGASIDVYTVRSDGGLEKQAQHFSFIGQGPVQERQEASHLHATIFTPGQNQLFAADLGSDKTWIFEVDANDKDHLLTPSSQAYILSQPGSGPRHLAFSKNGLVAYVLEELSGTISVFEHQSAGWQPIQRVPTHRPMLQSVFRSADIHLLPNGRFLYASNRDGEDNIAAFSVLPNGQLQFVGIYNTQGQHPRNFAIHPSGKFLLVANKNSDNLILFKVNQHTGSLRVKGKPVLVKQPACIQFSNW